MPNRANNKTSTRIARFLDLFTIMDWASIAGRSQLDGQIAAPMGDNTVGRSSAGKCGSPEVTLFAIESQAGA